MTTMAITDEVNVRVFFIFLGEKLVCAATQDKYAIQPEAPGPKKTKLYTQV